MGFFAGFARLLVIVFNFIFWLSGAAILGVGIWFLVDPNMESYLGIVKINADQSLTNAAYILIGFGSFIFLVGFCGCCGAIRNSKCLLGFYIFFLVLVFAGELGTGILVIIYKSEVESQLQVELVKSIKEKYTDPATKESWDKAQKELKCCGYEGPNDYNNSVWQKENTPKKIPKSCCVLDAQEKITNEADCQSMTADFHDTGCKESLKSWINSKSIILIGIGCGMAGLQIFGLLFAIFLCRKVDKEE
ncbi:CD9 antigen-like [Gigantopelta aegis]|uniref:CD9 antigen-like n=1 Tax=Gigantopelta aegis TaxID=1735272 RepID=UPI001B88BEDE|nr:CD9 antigen-like [Gigantopelta aegis]